VRNVTYYGESYDIRSEIWTIEGPLLENKTYDDEITKWIYPNETWNPYLVDIGSKGKYDLVIVDEGSEFHNGLIMIYPLGDDPSNPWKERSCTIEISNEDNGTAYDVQGLDIDQDGKGDLLVHKEISYVFTTPPPSGSDQPVNHSKLKKSLLILDGDFLGNVFFSGIKKCLNQGGKKIRFFVILGNDDPRIYEKEFLDADKQGLINYVHDRSVPFGDLFVTGYSYVPPTPFQLKDWERYDVSRYVDVGSVSPEEGLRTISVPKSKTRYSTITKDLRKLADLHPPERTIFLFHFPPYGSNLDRAELDGRKIDHVLLDLHVGSIAIQRFIEKRQPFLTLHGHIHESTRLTGSWKEQKGGTQSFSAAHDGRELSLVRFDTDYLMGSTRDLIL